MKDFKKMPKMACGGKVKKYKNGSDVRDSSRMSDDYQAAILGSAHAKTPIGKRAYQSALESHWDNKQIGTVDIYDKSFTARDEADAEAQRESTRGISPENRKKRGGKVTKKKK